MRSFRSGLSSWHRESCVRCCWCDGRRATRQKPEETLAWELDLMDSRWTSSSLDGAGGAAGFVETRARYPQPHASCKGRTCPHGLSSSARPSPARLDGPGHPERGPATCPRRGGVCGPDVRRSRPSLWEDGAAHLRG